MADQFTLKEEENKKQRAQESAERQAFENQMQDRANMYGDPNAPRQFQISGTPEERQQAQAGLEFAKVGYGQNIFDVGSDIQRVKELQRARTEGSDPVSEAIRSQKSGAVASAQRNLAAAGVKGGAAAGALEEIARKQDANIAASLYGQQRQNIAAERSLASNMLSGTAALMQGGRAEGAASNMPIAPSAGGIFGSTVICTELYRQGYMDLATYSKDSEYGLKVLKETPEVIVGYQFLANPIVKLMKKSPMFTKAISYPALKWARHIANEENSIIGVLAVNIGQPICGIIGKLLINVFGAKHV